MRNEDSDDIAALVFVIDACRCRDSLIELCVGLRSQDLPVLIILEIHAALCEVNNLHALTSFDKKHFHLRADVAWNIAKVGKHHSL